MAPLLIVLFLGGYVLLAACFVIGVMAVKEFYDGFGNMGIRPSYNRYTYRCGDFGSLCHQYVLQAITIGIWCGFSGA